MRSPLARRSIRFMARDRSWPLQGVPISTNHSKSWTVCRSRDSMTSLRPSGRILGVRMLIIVWMSWDVLRFSTPFLNEPVLVLHEYLIMRIYRPHRNSALGNDLHCRITLQDHPRPYCPNDVIIILEVPNPETLI